MLLFLHPSPEQDLHPIANMPIVLLHRLLLLLLSDRLHHPIQGLATSYISSFASHMLGKIGKLEFEFSLVKVQE